MPRMLLVRPRSTARPPKGSSTQDPFGRGQTVSGTRDSIKMSAIALHTLASAAADSNMLPGCREDICFRDARSASVLRARMHGRCTCQSIRSASAWSDRRGLVVRLLQNRAKGLDSIGARATRKRRNRANKVALSQAHPGSASVNRDTVNVSDVTRAHLSGCRFDRRLFAINLR